MIQPRQHIWPSDANQGSHTSMVNCKCGVGQEVSSICDWNIGHKLVEKKWRTGKVRYLWMTLCPLRYANLQWNLLGLKIRKATHTHTKKKPTLEWSVWSDRGSHCVICERRLRHLWRYLCAMKVNHDKPYLTCWSASVCYKRSHLGNVQQWFLLPSACALSRTCDTQTVHRVIGHVTVLARINWC